MILLNSQLNITCKEMVPEVMPQILSWMIFFKKEEKKQSAKVLKTYDYIFIIKDQTIQSKM